MSMFGSLDYNFYNFKISLKKISSPNGPTASHHYIFVRSLWKAGLSVKITITLSKNIWRVWP